MRCFAACSSLVLPSRSMSCFQAMPDLRSDSVVLRFNRICASTSSAAVFSSSVDVLARCLFVISRSDGFTGDQHKCHVGCCISSQHPCTQSHNQTRKGIHKLAPDLVLSSSSETICNCSIDFFHFLEVASISASTRSTSASSCWIRVRDWASTPASFASLACFDGNNETMSDIRRARIR